MPKSPKTNRVTFKRNKPAAKAVGEWRSDPPRLPPGWQQYFTRRCNIDHRIENNRHVDSLAVFQGFEDAEAADLNLARGGGVLRAFMQKSTEREDYVSGIEQFCCHMSLWRLLNDQAESSQRSIAWLDERSFAAGLMRSRPYRGPLTARSLYRFRDNIDRNGEIVRFKKKDQPEPNGEHSRAVPDSCCEADADRHQWTIYALVGTASYHQASPLRDCLNRYVEFETFIDVTFVVPFQLSFHLPHYVWRRAAHGRADHRRDSNAAPLRQTVEVSYLHLQNPSDRSFLYESQISCVIAGSDKRTWVGYCFVDTFFDVGSEVRESVHSIHDDLVDGGAHMDPFTYGIKDAESPIRDPREYFLTVFRLRARQVLTEWRRVVWELRQGIRAYELVGLLPLWIFKSCPTGGSSPGCALPPIC
ncbi:hypothetical protein VFPPC_16977 [Pochonia chlamydosporia 170]|uniref:Uncharacterized protein n=1 Tax=Pochonia chlamydosporia 170 TaxID=1380566 RepID=A0A179EYY8_METCM|nr:hypothetical protein VFPPC_16977 [Pochonia chlamydosporia 170]OAQ58415.1 hypothetical protein VFPPC_16977 [Pochonia chlamydosporia 170]